MKKNIPFFILAFFLIIGCKNTPKQYLVFDYEDFRYIEYDESIRHLDKNIGEVDQVNEAWANSLKDRLNKTKLRIIQEIKGEN